MARILLLLVIAFLIYLVLRALLRGKAGKDESQPTASTAAEAEDMVACARCGVNVPRSETRESDGRRVCASNPNCK